MDSKRFYREQTKNYDNSIIEHMHNIEKNYINKAKLKNRNIFLLKCRSKQLIPKFLNLKVKHIQFNNEKYKKSYETKFKRFIEQTISILISDNFSNLKRIDNDIIRLRNILKYNISDTNLKDFTKLVTAKYENNFNKIKIKNIKKIKNLETQQTKLMQPEYNNEWITNLTDITIPKDVNYVLSLGPKFALPTTNKNIPIPDIITGVETAITMKNEEIKDEIRNKICNTITNFMQAPKRKNLQEIQLNKKIKETKQFIKQHPEIIVINADKCQKTVIMKKDEYNNKIQEILNDSTTYKKIGKDPTTIYQNHNNKLLQEWINNKIMPKEEATRMKVHNSQPPKIHCLPKLHKTNIPLRPIISFIDSPLYKLSKYLSIILQNIVGKTNYHIKDSWDFVKSIKNITIPNNYSMFSLDVTSLYTNIPVDLVVNVINKKWTLIQEHTILPKNEFIKAIKLCCNSTYFQKDEEFYQQISGLPMGAPISAPLANIVMEDIEQEALTNLNIKMYKRYVDDIFIIADCHMITTIHNKFNQIHNKIQFTIEKEEDKTLNFLDITLKNNNGKLETTWYTKKVWSGRYLNYNSHQPLQYKKSVIAGLTDRAMHFTTPEQRPEQITKIKTTLKQNNYPDNIINTIVAQRIHKYYNVTNSNKNANATTNNIIYTSIPYIKGLSEKIENILKKQNIKIGHTSNNRINKFLPKIKPSIPKDKQTNTIYKIPCIDCEKCYVGQSNQWISNRLRGHRYNILDTNSKSTALKKHHLETGHLFDLKNTEILSKEPHLKKRLIKEMIYIKKENTVNDRTDINGLSKVYNNIIKAYVK